MIEGRRTGRKKKKGTTNRTRKENRVRKESRIKRQGTKGVRKDGGKRRIWRKGPRKKERTG